MMLAITSLTGCWRWLHGRHAQPMQNLREQQADAYRDLLIHDPDLQAETVARLFW